MKTEIKKKPKNKFTNPSFDENSGIADDIASKPGMLNTITHYSVICSYRMMTMKYFPF